MNRHQAAHALEQGTAALRLADDPVAALLIAEVILDHALKVAVTGESFAEDDATLPRIESAAIAGTLARWQELRDNTFAVLGLDTGNGAKAPATWNFDAMSSLEELANLQRVFVHAAGGEDSVLVQQAFRAWVRGLRNAAAELDAEAAIEATQQTMRETLSANNLQQVRDTSVRVYQNDIVAELQRGAYDGLNPNDVAARLRERFGMHDYDWERLARSEMTQAHAEGKEAQYTEMGVDQYDYVTANDNKVSAICREHAAGSPYPVGAGPLPMRDSHPNCRCTTRAHL